MVDQIVSELRELDDLLRGRKTDMRSLEKGVGHLNALLFLKASIILGIGYGMCMGLFAVVNLGVPGLTQLAATMIKVPMLFLLTIAVTYPSLYVFSAMLGAKFGPSANPPTPKRRKSDSTVREVFYIWACLYVFVTIQMSWVLRPLIGDPAKPFVWFGERGGSAVYDFPLTFGKLLG